MLANRYLNNPEIVAGAAFFGLALISGSKVVYTLAVIRHLSYWWFLRNVEKCVVSSRLSFSPLAHPLPVLLPSLIHRLYIHPHPPTARTCASSTAIRSGKTPAS